LHFHDLRGTAATRFYVAGLSTRVIAKILAWSEDQVERIIRRYVGRAAASIRPKSEYNLQNSLQNLLKKIDKYWSGRRESNPRMQLGKLPFYH
jgi:transposase